MEKFAGLAFVLVVFALTPMVFSQTGAGRIEGVVADPSGAIVPGAKITLIDAATGLMTAETLSDALGKFVFASVAPAEYTLTVELEGFRRLISRKTSSTASG